MKHDGLNICLIDDDRIYQFAARKIIEATGFAGNVLAFSNGKDAIQYLHDHLNYETEIPDVIFLDIHMPIMNGWQFLDEYKNIKPRLSKPVHIYMVSSSVDEIDIDKSKTFDTVSDYIIKPLKRDIFDSLLAQLAASRFGNN